MVSRIAIVVAVAAIVLAGCKGRTLSMAVESPWVRSASSGANSAVYMVIRNNGRRADRLLKAECTAAMMAEVHRTTVKDGVGSMEPVEAIEVPARGQVELAPAGFHVMLMRLKHDLRTGDRLEVILTFEAAGRIPVTAEVRTP
jgi:periplasmic copper chaperone A